MEQEIFPDRKYYPVYDKPKRTIWDDNLINQVICLIEKGYSLKQIAKKNDLSYESLKVSLANYRRNPKWAGKIPYFKHTPRSIVQQNDRIGIIDIEFFSLNFKANKGFILTYVLKEYHKNVWYSNIINPKDMKHKAIKDRNIVQKLVNDISKFDIIIGYFSNRCDIPFVRTRAMYHNIIFPFFNTIKQIDLWEHVRYKMSLDRNTLRNATKITHIVGKDHADLDLWMEAAICGDKEALKEIYKHNVRDVKITERLYDKIKPYFSGTVKSI